MMMEGGEWRGGGEEEGRGQNFCTNEGHTITCYEGTVEE
jgi:hypothetical protein